MCVIVLSVVCGVYRCMCMHMREREKRTRGGALLTKQQLLLSSRGVADGPVQQAALKGQSMA